jgi:carboxypeptidase Q
MESYHASTDTYDKADLAMLHVNAAVIGTLVWGLASADRRAARQDRAAIQGLLDATGLAEEMRTFNLYDDWAARRRGRAD